MTPPAALAPRTLTGRGFRRATMPRPIKISLVIAAAEASERLSSYGYNVERVAFNADGLVMTGLSHDNIYTFIMNASQVTDDVGTETAVCEFKSKRHIQPLKFSAGCDDFISALCLAIDEQAHAI